ncbi:carboxypeptidase regulatory-like domain-containing protein [Prolixibacteraceae bacterium JC049]|nr:carboxypeptidase regulatory-like domain-containing protein [Prolixibacteraceae bacterium JC049]
MNKFLLSKKVEMQNVVTFYQENITVFAENEFAKSVFETVESKYNETTALIVEYDASKEPITKQKHKAFKKLKELCAKVAAKMISYGNFNGFESFSEITGCTKSELNHCKQAEVIVHSKKLVTLINAHATEATASGVTEDEKTGLVAAYDEASVLLSKPRKLQIKYKQAREKIRINIDWFVQTQKHTLKGMMQANYAESHPEVYKKYLRTLNPVTPSSTKRCIEGKITNNKGEPLRAVAITINDEYIGKRGGTKGIFYISNIQPGLQKITFRLDAFQPQTQHVLIYPNTTLKLNVVLEPIPIPEMAEV